MWLIDRVIERLSDQVYILYDRSINNVYNLYLFIPNIKEVKFILIHFFRPPPLSYSNSEEFPSYLLCDPDS